MSSDNTSQNDTKPGGQPPRNPVSGSSSAGGLLSNLFSRGSSTKPTQRLSQLDVEPTDGGAKPEEEWEDLPERPTRAAVPPKSIMHTPSTPSREHKVSFEGDRRAASEGYARRNTSKNGSSRTGRAVDDFVTHNLQGSGAARGSGSTTTAGRRPARPSISPTRRQPVPSEAHPLATTHFPPMDIDATYLDPGNAPLGTADFDASRPLTPDVAWGEGEREALGMLAGGESISRTAQFVRNPRALTGFEVETIPPFDADPHSPLAELDPNFVPSRTMGRRAGSQNGSSNGSQMGTPPRPPIPGRTLVSGINDPAQGVLPRQPGDVSGEFQMGTSGLLRPDANVAIENAARRGLPAATTPGSTSRVPEDRYSPHRPHREAEIGPMRTHRSAAGAAAGSSNHRQNRNPRRRPVGPLAERERRERARQRQLASEPFRPLDPYAYPVGQRKSPIPPFLRAMRWAVSWADGRFGQEEEDELERGERPAGAEAPGSEGVEIPMTRRRSRSPPGDRRRRPQTTRPTRPNETPAQRVARERGESEARTTRVNARRLEKEIQEREERLAMEREELQRHRQMTDEEVREELEQALPVVPRTSPTRAYPGSTIVGVNPRIRHAITPHPSGTESAPVGRIPGQPSAGPSQQPDPNKATTVPETGKPVGTLSPPKASPASHAASDPASPVKRASPFNIGVNLPKIPKPDLGQIIDAGEQVELTLRQWLRFALVQAYRHLLLRMPSLYFNRVGRVFSEADFSEREISILLNRGVQDGPDSIAARVMDRRSPWRGFGGLSAMGDESEPLLSDGRDSNSPSPNQRRIQLSNANPDDHSDLEGESIYGGGSTLAGNGALPRIDPELKKSLEKLERFRIEWETFIDGMVKEWKTLNVVSALLLSALLTVFQIQDAAYVPVTRTAALLSLVSAFMSLLFGGVYIIRFSTMRTMRKAARWVEDTHKKKQKLLWNIWIMLSLPVTWLVYSLLFFCITILGFVWTSGTGTHLDPPTDDDHAAVILGPRIGVTALFVIGFIYFCLVLNTFRNWSGVTVNANNDTLVNLHSPDNGANHARLETSALMNGDGFDNPSPQIVPKGIQELDTIVPAGTGSGGSRDMDGLQALASSNVGKESRQQRQEDMIRGLEDHVPGGGSVGSASSALHLELTPPGTGRPSALRHSPNLLTSTLTSTPPRFTSSDLQPPPATIVTQPTPVVSTFAASTQNHGPLTAFDPSMDPHGIWSMQDPPPVSSPPFTRHSQALELEGGLPDRRTPPSTFASAYATPREDSVSEFGTISRAGGKMGRGS